VHSRSSASPTGAGSPAVVGVEDRLQERGDHALVFAMQITEPLPQEVDVRIARDGRVLANSRGAISTRTQIEDRALRPPPFSIHFAG